MTEFRVDESEAGTRMDLFLAGKLKLGRNEIKRMLGRGVVRLNGRQTTEKDKGLLLFKDSVVAVEQPAGGDAIIPEPDALLKVLSEGDGWIAIDKPAGIPVHPLESTETGTLLNAVVARYPQVHGVGEGALRSGVVHRLDVDTSGVILFATTQEMWANLRTAFEQHRTKKVYRAIVTGTISGDSREEMTLLVAQHRPARVKVVEIDHPQGRHCHLSWRAVEQLNEATLIEIELGTGFLHQIRVMMAKLGHPVIGDTVYGPASTITAPRQMLHASYVKAAGASAASPDPEDFAAFVSKIRG